MVAPEHITVSQPNLSILRPRLHSHDWLDASGEDDDDDEPLLLVQLLRSDMLDDLEMVALQPYSLLLLDDAVL